MKATKINKAGIELIKKFEGLRTEAYQDSVGIWTIGYGHTKAVKKGDVIDAQEAEKLLRDDLDTAQKGVSTHVNVMLNENQFAALVSFTFNLGIGSLISSTLLKRLNNNQYDRVPYEIRRWNKAGGKVLKGLVKRRKAESRLWCLLDD